MSGDPKVKDRARFRIWRGVVIAALVVGSTLLGYLLHRLGALWPLVLLVAALGAVAFHLFQTLETLESDRRRAVQALSELNLMLEGQTGHLSAAYRVANALSEPVELPELLERGLERVVCALGLDGGQIHLLPGPREGQAGDDEGQVMRLGALFGDESRLWLGEHTIRVGECVCGEAAAGDSPIVVHDLTNDPRIAGRACATGRVPSIASVPLKAKGGSLGVLTVRSCDPHHLAVHDVELLTAIANMMAAAIENARIRAEMEDRIAELSAEVQQLAIVEERERIGREMHDGLAQTLGLLNLQIEMVKGAAEVQDWMVAMEELALLDTYLGDAYSDVREVLSNLRHTEPQGEAFVPSLLDYLDDFGLRNQIEAVLVAEDSGGPVCFPPLVEVHLHRVIQEALTNVRRHAAASRVEVRIRQSVAGWDVVVSDDGTGFDVAGSGMGRLDSYGLLTMRERVAGLGGQFAIESQPGKGTRVCIFVPCSSDR